MHNKCLWFPPAACLAHPRLTDRLLWPLDLPSTQSDLRFLIYNSFLTGDRQGRNIGHASQVLSGVVPVRLQGALTAGISLVHRAGRWGWIQGTVASWRLRAHGEQSPHLLKPGRGTAAYTLLIGALPRVPGHGSAGHGAGSCYWGQQTGRWPAHMPGFCPWDPGHVVLCLGNPGPESWHIYNCRAAPRPHSWWCRWR